MGTKLYHKDTSMACTVYIFTNYNVLYNNWNCSFLIVHSKLMVNKNYTGE